MASLRVDVKEYVPSWARKTAPTNNNNNNPASIPTASPVPRKSGFTTSMTSTNVITTHTSTGSRTPHMPATMPIPSSNISNTNMINNSALSPGGMPGRSPTTALRFPTRMSPMHAPFPPVNSAMNPFAKDFIPHLSSANSLAPLPTSTAEIAEEQQRQQKQQTKSSPASHNWTTTSTKNNNTQPTMSPGFKASFTPTMAPIVVEKTEEEILEISKKSELKVEAVSFVPRRTLNRVLITKPSPLSLTPATGDMSLGDLWCLFYLPAGAGESIRENTYDPTLVFRVDSVATFWKVFNNVPPATEMNIGTLYFFRDGIYPKWEDPANSDGGILKMKLDSTCINDAWILLLCRTIGESWSKAVRNTINGVALKVRERGFILEVWVTKQSPGLMADMSELLQPLLGAAFSLHYAPHSVNQERAAALAEKEKKNRNNNRSHNNNNNNNNGIINRRR